MSGKKSQHHHLKLGDLTECQPKIKTNIVTVKKHNISYVPEHMHPIGQWLHQNIKEVIITDHPGRLEVSRAQCLVVSITFFATIIVANLGAMPYWYNKFRNLSFNTVQETKKYNT